jgi:Protein of unknown function (DUF3352)
MKKVMKWMLILLALGVIGYFSWKWFSPGAEAPAALSLVPPDAIYLFETNTPIESWKTISGSAQWKHLQKNTYFASLTSATNSLDSLIRDNDLLFNLIGSRSVIVSAHIVGPRAYDFLFVVDLKEASFISVLQQYLTSFSGKGYTVKKDNYRGGPITQVHNAKDNSTLSLVMKEPYFIGSYSRKLITASLDAFTGTNLSGNASFQNLLAVEHDLGRVYINFPQLPAYASVYTEGNNAYVNQFSSALQSSVLNLSLENETFQIKGVTLLNDSIESYIKSLHVSGKGPTEIVQVVPQRTAFYLGMGFNSFSEFFKNFETNLKANASEYTAYRESFKRVEDFLNIDLQKNVMDWIGDEVAIMELQSAGSGAHNEAVLVLKAHNIESAKENLDHIEKMVRKRTPVKFKSVAHRGYAINYLSMKGLFNVLFGKFFARYDKPYYTIINNFVIFSNGPEAIKSIINDYLDKNTLSRSEEFRAFRKKFEDEGSVFVYMHAPALFTTARNLANPATRTTMTENKEFIVCFRDIGIQLVPVENGFETILMEHFVAPEEKPQAIEVVAKEEAVDAEPTDVVEDVEEVAEPKTDEDPMALPELYNENPNAKEYFGYFPDSTVQFKGQAKNGFKDGDYTEYHPNGEKRMTGKFKNDKRHGTWRLYNKQGKLILKREYRNGAVEKERKKE